MLGHQRPTNPDEITVSFGAWEPDPEAVPTYEAILPGRGGPVVLRPGTGGWRRKRFEAWTEDGREVGCWAWERRRA